MSNALNSTVEEVSSFVNNSTATTLINQSSSKKYIRMLSDSIDMAKEWFLDAEMLNQAEILLKKLEISQQLFTDIIEVQKNSPITNQSKYIQFGYKLEKSIEKAVEVGFNDSQLQLGLDLLAKCQSEYWLSALYARLENVITAVDANEHDMNKLREAISRAQLTNSNETLIESSSKLLGRLDVELGITRSLKAFPTVKLPIDNPPDGYYTEKDLGKIKETEGYPLPPEGGDYIWLPAENYYSLTKAVEGIKACLSSGEISSANPSVVQEAKERLVKAEKEVRVLEAKDTADKAAALEQVKKLAKKLKGKKKKAA